MHDFEFVLFLTTACWFWCRFQKNWPAKYPWSQQDPKGDGTFDKVRCIICFIVNGKDKILDAKDDNLKKHQGWKRTLNDLPSLKVKKGEWYWDQISVHKRAERTFAVLPVNNIGTLITIGTPPKCNEVQMTVIFHLLQFGRPMTKYLLMKELLQFLDVPKVKIFHFLSISVVHVFHFILEHHFG